MNRTLIAGMMMFACARTPGTPAPPPQSEEPPAQTQTADTSPRVIFPDGFAVHVEIAANDELRAQGLMFRDQLRPGTGMLFFFPEAGDYPFWMKNTLIPLDMIWIDSAKRIVHIAHDVPPCKVENCPSYPPHAIASYVLEVAGGVANTHGLKDGDVLRFEGTENVVAK